MSLLDKLKELQELAPESKVDADVLLNGQATQPKQEPDEDDEDDEAIEDEGEASDETAEEEAEPVKDDKEAKVEGYRGRKIKAAEKEAEEARAREKAAQERADRLEKQIMDISSKLAEPRKEAEVKQEVRKPDRYEDPDAWVEDKLTQGEAGIESLKNELQNLKVQQAYSAATNQLLELENSYKQSHPEYDEVVKYGLDREVRRTLALDPTANESQVRAKMNRERVELAAHFVKLGKDPVASIHNFMVEVYGYQPKEVKKPSGAKENLEAVKKNKSKSFSGLNAGGRGADSSEVATGAGRKMSISEFSKLSPAEKEKAFADRR